MNNQVNTQIKVVKIPSATETLSNLNVGDCGFIKTRNLKLTSIRSAVRYLATQGLEFECSEKGLVNEVFIKRIK